MARKRMVSPELLTSESVASLPIPTRYSWVALWMYVDDEGRGRDNVALIRAHTWPLDETYTARKVAADLDRLAGLAMICRYMIGDEHFLHLPTWGSWQKVSHPAESRIPPCPLESSGASHEDLRRTSGGPPRSVVKFNVEEVKGPECEHGVHAPEALRRCPLCRRAGVRVVGSA